MLRDAIEIRKIHGSSEAETRYEVYDTDTGTSLGIYHDLKEAENMRQSMKSSEAAENEEANDPDPRVE